MISALASVALAAEYANTTGAANDSRNEDLLAEGGGGGVDSGPDGSHEFPAYIRTTSMVFCIFILGIGIIGNVMVPLVILKSRDMRNSTNIFLTNLSIADLMVLLVCTPTVLVEVNSKPETWVLGSEMCKAVPFVELTVAHASVLTILAISFERYYAICEPLKAGYVCTKERALLICFLAWAFAALFTSPVLLIAEYGVFNSSDPMSVASAVPTAVNVTEPEPYCMTRADTFWRQFFFLMTISVFFLLPLVLLLVLYTLIARRLVADPGTTALTVKATETANARARKQVVLMLGTVVMSFFICLLPFRIFTIIIIFMSTETFSKLGFENYLIVLLVCRTMLYLNSAINPILYNLMSSKFRDGFMRLCGIRRRDAFFRRRFARSSTLNTTTTSMTYSGSRRYHHGVMRSCSGLSLDSRTLIFANNSPRASPPAGAAGNGHGAANGTLRRNVIIRSSLGVGHGLGHLEAARASFRDRYTAINHNGDDVHPESYV